MKRLGVFVFFNKDGYVEDYVDYLLKEMNKNLDILYIMVIGKLDERGKKVLSKYTKNIAYRENKGFTGEAWQDSIINQITFNELYKYDEVVFFNDIFYGPLFSIKRVFDEMAKRKSLDFWGITRHYQTKDFTGTYENGIIPEHIQTYFYVVKHKMLISDAFKDFWIYMPEIKTAQDDVAYQETRFTDYFSKLGYKWDTYVNMESLKGKDLNNYCMNYEIPYTLISKLNMPFVRRKSLVQVVENSVSGPETEARRTLDYIEKKTKYDVNLVWDDLLRNNNLIDLYTKLHLDYILPTDRKIGTLKKKYKIAIIANNDNYKINNYDFYLINKIDINKIIGKYDYICYINDEDINNDNLLLNKSNKELLFDNALFSGDYIKNIIYTFEHNPKLGYLGLPEMIGNAYWPNLKNNWDSVIFNEVNKALNGANNVLIEKKPLSYTKAFWLKTSSIENVKIDKKNMNLIIPYIAQKIGYYSGIVYSNEYASIYLPAIKEEYRRYSTSHPYAAVDSIPLLVLIKGIITKIKRRLR